VTTALPVKVAIGPTEAGVMLVIFVKNVKTMFVPDPIQEPELSPK
jgi:hypothetical protein